jgi:hypothetical protein
MSKTEYVPNGISIQSSCLDCIRLDEQCPVCEERAEANLCNLAHEIVDEGNLQYKFVWSDKNEPTSNHDWVGSETKLDRPYFSIYTLEWVDVRKEFIDPITWLQDREFSTDYELTAHETVCDSCHYACNAHVVCPNCN